MEITLLVLLFFGLFTLGMVFILTCGILSREQERAEAVAAEPLAALEQSAALLRPTG